MVEVVPYERLTPEALRGVIEDFVTREGTDYGTAEVPLETKVKQVLAQLQRGTAVVTFDVVSETCSIERK